MNPKNKLAEMPIRPLLYTMAVPLMLSLLIQSLYNIVDSIFVARLSETALTAASLVYAIQFLMIAIGVGTAVGLNALLSRKLGQKKPEEACRAATTGLFLMLGTSLVFTLVGLLFSNQIAAALTGDPELQQLCREYLSVNLVFCWGIFLQTYGQRLLQAVGDTVLSMVSLIIGAVVNIILDPIMIFGLLGCPAMGIRGAAIATVIGQLIGAAAALWFNQVKNPVIHVRLKGYRFLWQDVADIYRVGLPTIVMQAIGSVMTFAVNGILLGGVLHGGGLLRHLLQAAKLPDDAGEWSGTGGHPGGGLQLWQWAVRPGKAGMEGAAAHRRGVCPVWHGGVSAVPGAAAGAVLCQ